MAGQKKAAIWQVYIMGRWGIEKSLGQVMASASDMSWIKSFPTLACDKVTPPPANHDAPGIWWAEADARRQDRGESLGEPW